MHITIHQIIYKLSNFIDSISWPAEKERERQDSHRHRHQHRKQTSFGVIMIRSINAAVHFSPNIYIKQTIPTGLANRTAQHTNEWVSDIFRLTIHTRISVILSSFFLVGIFGWFAIIRTIFIWLVGCLGAIEVIFGNILIIDGIISNA